MAIPVNVPHAGCPAATEPPKTASTIASKSRVDLSIYGNRACSFPPFSSATKAKNCLLGLGVRNRVGGRSAARFNVPQDNQLPVAHAQDVPPPVHSLLEV